MADEKKAHDADEVLVCMRLLLTKAIELGAPPTRSVLQRRGAKTPRSAGVPDWFGRINAHGVVQYLALEHDVISFGNENN